MLLVGHSTPAANLSAGTATYSGGAVGILADCLIVEDLLHGFVTVTADFDSLQVSTQITLDRSNDQPWGVINSGITPIETAEIDARFNALEATSDQGMTGHVHGFSPGHLPKRSPGSST